VVGVDAVHPAQAALGQALLDLREQLGVDQRALDQAVAARQPAAREQFGDQQGGVILSFLPSSALPA
jgi:hypothetical protein